MNNKSCIEISIPYHKEVEGPLGGISIEYVIKITAERNAFDKNCNTSGIVNYQTLKSFRECEDFLNKLSKKYPDVNFPSLSKSLSNPATSAEKRADALNNVMKFITTLPDVASSSVFIQFLAGMKLQDLEEKTIQENDIDNSTTIFKKMKIKPKITPDTKNSNEPTKTTCTSDDENLHNSLTEEQEDIFIQSRKRNETGSRPLFDENSINQRSEKLNLPETVMFDPQDYDGPLPPQEDSVFLIPGAESSNSLLLKTKHLEDTLDLLNIDDNIDHFLKDIGNNKLLKQKYLTSEVATKKTQIKPPVPLKPIPTARSHVIAGPDSTSTQKPRPTPRPRNLSKVSAEESKHIKDIDIEKYIEDEQKNNNNEPDLFL